MTYRAKIDWLIGLGILAGIGIPTFTAIQTRTYWVLAAPAGIVFLILICCYPQHYEITDTTLVIRAGLTNRVIPWRGVRFVGSSSAPRSSVALSLDRILIEHTGGGIMIAPSDQRGFLADLARHCPQLSRRGMDLVIAIECKR